MENIHRILDALHSTQQKAVLATIIQVEGSAYRKAGTCMLFQEDGTQVGVLSAGCLEEDLSARVKNVLDKEMSQTMVFDMRSDDDLSWGQGAGCNGALHVLLEPVDAKLRNHLNELRSCLHAGKPVVIVKKLTDDFSVSDYLFIANNQLVFGEWQGAIPNQVINSIRQPGHFLPKSGAVFSKELSSYVYIHCFYPKPRLIVFGAGQDAIPLAKFASETGFSVVVSDWRPALCNNINFPNTDALIVGFPAEVVDKVKLTASDFVVILTHNFQRDKELLQLLAKKKLRYLGVLGSTSRTMRLLDGKEISANIHTPVGLPIGAEGPEEIAISILAELIQIQRKQSMAKVVSL